MVETASRLQFRELGSELEALLTEAELIGTYQPPFNVLLKDDKSPIYIHITNEEFPQVKTVRKQQVIREKLKGTVLGPYQSSYRIKEVLLIARRIFRWCSDPQSRKKSKACFYFHIGQCSGACAGNVSAAEYQTLIDSLILFLRGKTTLVTKNLESELEKVIENENFERAAIIRDQLAIIRDVTSKKYRMKPNLQLLPQLSAKKTDDGLVFLSKILKDYIAAPLSHKLEKIEGYDVSNLSGTNAAVAMVSFTNGEPDKTDYRIFNIRGLKTPNDYKMLQEALQRRQNHPEWGKPSLIVIDGGKGQLRAAMKVWFWRTPIISIAKRPDRIIIPAIEFHQKETGKPYDLENLEYHVLKLPEQHPALRLITQVRDESHRFSKKQHIKLRARALVSEQTIIV